MSVAGDKVSIHYHGIGLRFLNARNGLEKGEIPWLRSNGVGFSISRRTRRRLQDVFDRFAPEEYDYAFSKSEVRVKLYQGDYVSPSEGHRLVSGLEEFRYVVPDLLAGN